MKSFVQSTSQQKTLSRRVVDDSLDLWSEGAKPAAPAVDPMAPVLFLRRNILNILVPAILVAAVAFGASVFIFNKYAATAIVLVDPRTAKVTENGGVLSNFGSDAIAIESFVQVAHSDGFLGKLADQLDLVHDDFFAGRGATETLIRQATIEKLAAKLNIARRGTTYVIDVTATTPSPGKSAKIANAAAKLLIDDQAELRTGASETAAQKIENRLAELRGRVSRAEEAAAEMKAKLKVTDAGQNSTLLERRVFELNQQMVLAGARTGEARARFELLRRAGVNAGENLSQAVQSTVLSALRAEYARLSRQSADQATVLGARHPDVASLNAQIADVKRQIGAEISRMMATARTEFLEAEQREASLARQLKDAQNESGVLGPQLVKLADLEREAKAERAVFEQLLNRQRELSETKNLEPSDIRIVSEATPPTKTAPGKAILAGGAAALGLLAGLLWALVSEFRRPTLKTTREAERLAGASVLGVAPLLAAPVAAEGARRRRPDLTPWLDELCASLAPSPQQRGASVLLVSSAQRGEGRSTIAANVARWFGGGGSRVLLIEGDRPRDQNARRRFGLLDVLDSGEELRQALVQRPSYTLLPFGGATVSERTPLAALMSSLTLRATFGLLRRWFDVIVIDGPPALESAHGHLLAAQADATIFVIEWDKTTPAQITDALARLGGGGEAALVYNKTDGKKLSLFDPTQSRRMASRAAAFSQAA